MAFEELTLAIAIFVDPSLALEYVQRIDSRRQWAIVNEESFFQALTATLKNSNQKQIARTREALLYHLKAAPVRRAEFIAKLMPHLEEDQRRPLIADVMDSMNGSSASERATVLVTIAPWLSPCEQTDALEAIRGLTETGVRANLFVRILPALGPDVQDEIAGEALREIAKVPDPIHRSSLLYKTATCIRPDQQETVLGAAVEAALSVPDHQTRALTLVALLPQLSGQLSDEVAQHAADAAIHIKSTRDRIDALLAIYHHVRETAFGEEIVFVINALISKVDNHAKQYAIHKTLGEYERAYEVTRRLAAVEQRVEMLTDLIPSLTEAVRPNAINELVGLIKVQSEHDRSEHFKSVVKKLLENGDAVSAVCVARTINEGKQRAELLTEAAVDAARCRSPQLQSLCHETLMVAAERPRPESLADLHSLEPIMTALAPTALTHVAKAIQDVGRWW